MSKQEECFGVTGEEPAEFGGTRGLTLSVVLDFVNGNRAAMKQARGRGLQSRSGAPSIPNEAETCGEDFGLDRRPKDFEVQADLIGR